MRITGIDVFGYELTYAHGRYVMSGGRAASTQTSTVVRLQTDSGLEGWAETCPLGATYLPSFSGGVREALLLLGEAVLGLDPRDLLRIHERMNAALLGNQAAKSAIDIACWDLLGLALQVPITTLLGGRTSDEFLLYEAVPLGPPAAMAEFARSRAAAGIRHFQLKVGNDPHEDFERVTAVIEAAGPGALIVADANGGWGLQEAIIACRLMADLPILLEQPCRSTSDCSLLRPLTPLPFILDESVVEPEDVYEAKHRAGASAINIKLSRVGGMTGMRLMRDLALALNLSVSVEDTWGGDLTTAAVSHLAASTSSRALLTTPFFNDWTNEHIAGFQPRSAGGRGSAPTEPGLGVAPELGALGRPLYRIRP